jgi:hypothetical protein
LWRPPPTEAPRGIPALSPVAENVENTVRNAENEPPPVQSRASPWFAARRPLALPAGDSSAGPPPEDEAGPQPPRMFPWFG